MQRINQTRDPKLENIKDNPIEFVRAIEVIKTLLINILDIKKSVIVFQYGK